VDSIKATLSRITKCSKFFLCLINEKKFEIDRSGRQAKATAALFKKF